MTRTDIHSPSNFDPAEYEYVGAFDAYPEAGQWLTAEDRQARDMLETDGFRGGNWETKGTCDHCGARIRYICVFRHLSGVHIATGETCAYERFSCPSRLAYDIKRLRDAAKAERERIARRESVQAWLETQSRDIRIAMDLEQDLIEAFEMPEGSYPQRTITDIREKVWNVYGSITPGQLRLIERLVAEAPAQAERARLIAAERSNETNMPTPEGRVAFEGVVIKRVVNDGDYGTYVTLTIKVKDFTGNVWFAHVTEPNAVECNRGDVVQLKATLTRGTGEWTHFAKGKRPSNFVIVRHEELGEADALAD